MDYEDILYTKENGIATITLNRPEKLNAMRGKTTGEIRSAIEDTASDMDVRVLVVTGAGRAFCAGVDMKLAPGELSVVRTRKGALLQNLAGGLDNTMAHLEKPTIASINGPAFGMGCDLALACDLRIAAENTYLSVPFSKLGMLGGGAIWYLPRLVGLAKAFEMLYLGDNIPAKEAERIGLINRAVPNNELEQATAEVATRLAKMSTITLQSLKHAIYVGLENDLLRTLEHITYGRSLMAAHPDNREGMRAFAEKREPAFTAKSLH